MQFWTVLLKYYIVKQTILERQRTLANGKLTEPTAEPFIYKIPLPSLAISFQVLEPLKLKVAIVIGRASSNSTKATAPPFTFR